MNWKERKKTLSSAFGSVYAGFVIKVQTLWAYPGNLIHILIPKMVLHFLNHFSPPFLLTQNARKTVIVVVQQAMNSQDLPAKDAPLTVNEQVTLMCLLGSSGPPLPNLLLQWA